MGLFEKIFGKQTTPERVKGYFKTLTAYNPVFTSYSGGVYEMELTRAAIHARATHISKLKPEVIGSAYKSLNPVLQNRPNPFMDTTKFLYKLSTTLDCENTAFIVPMYDRDGETIIGYYPINPMRCEVREYEGQPYLVYRFGSGQTAAIEFERVGILNKFFYKDDLFGESNRTLNPTMQLMNIQNQGIMNGVKQSAAIRFITRLTNTYKETDIRDMRKRFSEENLSADNDTGVLMFDSKVADVKQVLSKPFIIDSAQMEHIKNNVFSYFGVNEGILQNKFKDEDWSAFYEGGVEPFSLQLSLVMTNMTYTQREVAVGNKIMWTSNRLQYAKTETKLQVVTQLFDRGLMTKNQGLEVFNMPPVKDGDKYYIRKEYAEMSKLNEAQGIEEVKDDAIQDGGTGVQVNAAAGSGSEGEATAE
ncbi:MAG: phage portal protein [Eubacteriales bacterium]